MTIMNPTITQHQSPFFRLPGELRNKIYTLVLTSNKIIIDPHIPNPKTPIPKSTNHSLPPLGTALLRTCKQAHAEVPTTQLLSNNRFRFTTLTDAHDFIRSLGPTRAFYLHDIELDLFSSQYKTTARREWSHYLAWLSENGIWARNLTNLQRLAPNLRILRLDIGRDVIWSFLEGILRGPRGLDRIVVSGSGEPSCCAAWEASENWAWDFCRPMNFLGKPRSEPHVVDLMLGCVEGEDREKVICWERDRDGRRVTIDVLHEQRCVRRGGSRPVPLTVFDERRSRLPVKGACRYEDYDKRRAWKIDFV